MGATARRFVDEQRLAFGRVAALYDRVRPSYPAAVIDDVAAFAGLTPPARILEVGAGTGKATVLFAERGFRVLGLEPSQPMASLARANCAAYPGVEIVESEFEPWRATEPWPALVCAAVWHWLDPERRFAKARDALVPGGALAAIWTFPAWERCVVREALQAAYRAAAPQLEADFPMHPASVATDLASDWEDEVQRSDGFAQARVNTYPWSLDHSPAGYAALLETHQDHVLMAPGARHELLTAVIKVIEVAGGGLTLPLRTRLCLARRV